MFKAVVVATIFLASSAVAKDVTLYCKSTINPPVWESRYIKIFDSEDEEGKSIGPWLNAETKWSKDKLLISIVPLNNTKLWWDIDRQTLEVIEYDKQTLHNFVAGQCEIYDPQI